MGKFLLLLVLALTLYFTYSIAGSTVNGMAGAEVAAESQRKTIAMENLKSGRSIVTARVLENFDTIPTTTVDLQGGTVTYSASDTLGSYKIMHVTSSYGNIVRHWQGVVQSVTSSNIDSPALYVNSGGDLTFTANSNSWNITGNSEVHAMGLETQDQFDSMVAQIRNGREDQVSGVSATNDIIVSELDEMYLAALSHFQVNNDSHITNGDLFDSAYLGTEQDPQVVVVDSDIVVAGNTTGYGVLVVNGDFDIRGNFEWNGLVIANLGYGDSFATGRGTSTISGRLWIRSEGNTTVELKGTPTITANDSGYMQNLIENHGVGQGWLPAEYHEIESYYPTGE